MLPNQETSAAQAGQRLRRLSWGVRGLILAGSPFLLTVPVLLVLAPEWLLQIAKGEIAGVSLRELLVGEFTLAARLRCMLVSLIPVGLWAAALWQLWQLFACYGRQQVFTVRAVGHLRRFSWALLVLAAVEPVSRALMSVAISWDNPPGKRMLMLTLGSNDYQLLLCAAVFVTVAHVMAQALRVAEENEQFV